MPLEKVSNFTFLHRKISFDRIVISHQFQDFRSYYMIVGFCISYEKKSVLHGLKITQASDGCAFKILIIFFACVCNLVLNYFFIHLLTIMSEFSAIELYLQILAFKFLICKNFYMIIENKGHFRI